MSKTTAIAVTEKSVAAFVMDALPNLQNYAVRKYDAMAWAKTAMLCIVESPDLLACLQTEVGKRSLYHALRFAAATGLSLNPQEGKAALVPIQGEVHYWPMKNGIIDLVLATGRVRSVYGDTIRENDKFKIIKSIKGDDYEHIPALKKRGEITGFYSAILENDGTGHVYYMTREEIEEHKKKYGKGLDKPKSAWNTSWEGMGIKTVIKLGAARLDFAPEERKLLDGAEESDDTPIPTAFTEIPGVTAAEVEKKLGEKKTAEEPPKTEAQSGGDQVGSAPASQGDTGSPPPQTSAVPPQAAATPAPATSAPAAGTPPPAKASNGKGELDIF